MIKFIKNFIIYTFILLIVLYSVILLDSIANSLNIISKNLNLGNKQVERLTDIFSKSRYFRK